MTLTPLDAAMAALIGLPLIASAMVRAGRGPDEGMGSEAAEWRALALMILPVFLGLIFLGLNTFLPTPLAALPDLDLFVGEATGTAAQAGAVDVTKPFHLPFGAMAATVYGLGFVAWAGRLAHCHLYLHDVAGASQPMQVDGRSVLVTERVLSPFVYARHIVLPQWAFQALDGQALNLIVDHEQAHIRRRDQHRFILLAWIDALFWFNPFVRHQTKRCRLAAELNVDAAVIAAAPKMRKVYAQSLVLVLKHTAGHALHGAPAVLSPRYQGEAKMRMKAIMGLPSPRGKRRLWTTLSALGALVPLTVGQWALAGATAANGVLSVVPVEGEVSARYDIVYDPLGDGPRRHSGIDFKAPLGTPIKAAGSGRVTVARDMGAYGITVVIDHGDGLQTFYAHMNNADVRYGQTVTAGQTIGAVGSTGRSTGPHLHLEVRQNGLKIDPASVIEALATP
ncbi:M23/M56 family metallopeptidase [Parvularcula sp. LCG005]|uniref:M23/M56 family metallopeptidase n=1 Tax=Parvularcula sp. LCG005 TaxID=3078805 RepID=UPI002942EA31|nr:M23/M56 family metallopeptidase [Parvularcula sp. LCG005]WOI53360.1 M23/M56 family metallopeptidase [Parvularcula sp. LCG005]